MPSIPSCIASSIRRGALALLLVAAGSPGVARAASVETFVIAIAGQTEALPGFACTVFGPATPGIGFFLNATPNVPVDGLGNCGIAGGFRTTTLAGGGPLDDTRALTTAFEQNTFTGSTLALARTGSVLAEAHATFTGPSNSLIAEGAASYALFEDALTATSPSVAPGTTGTIRLRFTVAGALSVAGPPPFSSTADVELNYSVGGGPSFILMRAQASRADLLPFATSGNGAPLTGFTLAPGSFAGAGTVDALDQPITWGTPFALKFGLLAGAIPGTGATADVDFTEGATLTGIQLFANGVPVHDFAIASDSGTPYDANGVPEPAGAALVSAGTLALALVGRRRDLRANGRTPRSPARAAPDSRGRGSGRRRR